MNVIIEIRNARGQFMEFLRKHNFDWAWKAMMEWDISKMYYVHSTPSSAWYIASYIRLGEKEPDSWKWVHATVEEFIQYYEWKTETDTRYMPSTAWPKDYWLCSITVTQDPDSWKVTHLHTKFLPTMNAYNTLVIKKDTTTSTQKKPKPSELVVIPFEVRLGRSAENVKAELLRLIPEDIDVDDVNIMIQEIF